MSPRTGAPGSDQAKSLDEIKPLIELCRAGKLFAIQEWIAEGKPVNPPPFPRRSNHARAPLDIAVETGFHSLVEVLLKAGAEIDIDPWNGTMARALKARRFDIVQLLVEHGYDPKMIDMKDVFNTWDPAMMEYFIERGADVEAGNPLAWAFCNRIRTALRVLKRFQDQFPSFREQANIALRHHCKEGNLKWVSLLLWAGADPYALGLSSHDEEPDPEDEGLSALGYAALYGHFDVFKLRQVKLDPAHPRINDILRYADHDEGIELIKVLLEKGLNPNDAENGGCSMIQRLLHCIDEDFSFYRWHERNSREKIDSERARDKIEAIHLLAMHGAKWVPKDKNVKDARKSLLKLKPDFTIEFVWIMSKYAACAQECIQDLIATPTMKAHLSQNRARLQQILAAWPGS
jgi:ankyrin repeat protein